MRTALAKVLTSPTAEDLRRLRADMLEAGVRAESRVWSVVSEYHGFLDEVATSSSSRDYSQLASLMDVSAISGVLVENILETADAGEMGNRILTGLLTEGLMVLATRQHVKAWEGELTAVYRSAAWYLYGELWSWAEEQKPELDAGERRRLLDRLMEPVHDPKTRGLVKAVLLGRLFQLLLVSHLAEAVD